MGTVFHGKDGPGHIDLIQSVGHGQFHDTVADIAVGRDPVAASVIGVIGGNDSREFFFDRLAVDFDPDP